jgi:hypothetical protein
MDSRQVVNIYVLGPYVLTFDATISVEYFSCESYNEVMFTVGPKKYQVVNNFHMGPRIIINPLAGGCEDIPFKPGTFWLLPEGVTAEELSKEQFAHVSFTR